MAVVTRPRSTTSTCMKRRRCSTQARSGDLGEMLQECSISDHRIELKFDEKDGEEEDGFDGDEDEEEDGAAAGTQAAPGQVAAATRDRNARGRRGRGATAAGESPRAFAPVDANDRSARH